MIKLDINTNALKGFTKKLKSLHKSALPVAIRSALNDAAFNLKQDTMPRSANKAFTQRQKNFFTANSKAVKAEGFVINEMQSTVGFYENKLASRATNYAIKDLEQQEHGGVIKKKSLIPMKTARQGNSANKVVRQNARITSLRNKKFVKTSGVGKTRDGGTMHVASRKQKFIRAAFIAKKLYGNDAYVLGNRNAGGSRTLSLINDISQAGKNGLRLKRTPLYNVKKGRVTTVKPKQFMKRASHETAMNIDKFYIKQAQIRFKKHGLIK